ncbi:RNA polymerase sigma factor [Alicyclobacillus cycloheptanicus]|uniref:RNA polymerase sigma factor n=1 Tax=Alicyclobacillus cycloheptanicus TaxID=1457 RepID=A0ABT9XHM7_9BACL|nr:RNA polymerase sigma factor [Alicyclobacillus cycloheptanicus]MDQ0189793.1 RNA polymerase sigma-70 factor (ECF subfamily) [Alicyclobacillus cycloheptanicus]WDM02515.1 RNA polymerase sigma factor [Alicyclobacillus cycloheptanicus]
MKQDDVDLIRVAKQGRTEAFEALVRQYKAFVFRTAYGILRNNMDAEDVTQETFIKVYHALRGLREERTFPSWLARVTVRTALDWVSKHKRQPSVPLDAEQVSTRTDVHASADIRMDVERALDGLTTEQRTIVVLRDVQGFGYDEIAEILDIPIGTVRSRLHYARAQLRELLTRGDTRGDTR